MILKTTSLATIVLLAASAIHSSNRTDRSGNCENTSWSSISYFGQPAGGGIDVRICKLDADTYLWDFRNRYSREVIITYTYCREEIACKDSERRTEDSWMLANDTSADFVPSRVYPSILLKKIKFNDF